MEGRGRKKTGSTVAKGRLRVRVSICIVRSGFGGPTRVRRTPLLLACVPYAIFRVGALRVGILSPFDGPLALRGGIWGPEEGKSASAPSPCDSRRFKHYILRG